MKVISIGNLSMGGTGKTPHTIYLAKLFTTEGRVVTILSRGYKGLVGSTLNVISDGHQIFYAPPQASDEAFMMARNCNDVSVITGVDRNASLKYAAKNFNSDLAILDDAYQYKKIDKNIEILLLDAKNPISTGFIFPFGYLREMPSNIKRADIIIFTNSKDNIIPEKVQKYIQPHQKVFFSRYTKPVLIKDGISHDISELKGKKVTAYSALANNRSFYDLLIANSIDVVSFKTFMDHKKLSQSTLDKIIDNGLTLSSTEFLTTEKDYVKLEDTYSRIFSYIKVDLEIDNKEELLKLIRDKIKE